MTRFSELKEKEGGTGSGLGWMKDGTLREIDPQSLISQLPGNFMIWLMLEFFFSIDFSKKKEFLRFIILLKQHYFKKYAVNQGFPNSKWCFPQIIMSC